MKDAFTRKTKNEEFRLERFTFLRKAQAVEESKKKREILAATRIQALYRGYYSRPNIHRNKRRKKIIIMNSYQMKAFLCTLTKKLKFKHIPGLTLKMKATGSRQKIRIENAASYIIQRFFKMIVARKKAREIMTTEKSCRSRRATYVLTKFLVAYVSAIKFGHVLKKKKRTACILIQTRMRIFLARRL